MKKLGWSTNALVLAAAVCLACCLAPVRAGFPDDCCDWDSPYGDGSNGIVTIDVDTVLTEDMNYRSLTVLPGVTLDTAGHIVRVCGTLLNEGTITDSFTGGRSGSTAGGRGQDPCQDSGGPPWPEEGSCLCIGIGPQYPQSGHAGGCGGGGGGGGGAKWEHLECVDADGGDGGDGGAGGNGGGYVRIYAFNLDNRGEIHANGADGADGEPGGTGEYVELDPPLPLRDFAGGGGGGGAGGGGGDAGTVEIYYANLVNLNEPGVHADGGERGAGAPGGYSGTTLVGYSLVHPDDFFEIHYDGALGCPPPPTMWRGGDGGDGEHRQNHLAEDGDPGVYGPDGAAGQVMVTWLPAGYSVTGLGPAPGLNSHAQAINNTGRITGYADTPAGQVHAFLWCNGTMYDLGTLTGENSRAYDINELGQVVGCAETSSGATHAFLWLPEPACNPPLPAGMNDLDPDGLDSCAYGINDSTNVVGRRLTPDYDEEAFLWLCQPPACGFDEKMNSLHPDHAYVVSSEALAINNSDEVVGSALYVDPPAVWGDDWLWRCDDPGSWDILCGPYGYAYPHAITQQTYVVGGDFAAFLYVPGEGCNPLPTLGGEHSSAKGINELTHIVGWSELPVSPGQHACIWLERMVYDLNDLTPPPAIWSLKEAADINEAGQIVGWGYTLVQGEYAFLLTPRPCIGFLPCDANCDGVLNAFDIDAFVLALTDAVQYAQTYADCNWLCTCDIDGNGRVNAFDIDPFVECLVGDS